MERHALILELTIHLARICEAGASLPTVELVTETADEDEREFTDHTKKWSILLPRLQSIFGKNDPYWRFDPTTKEEPVQGTISDDVADIYLDLKEALAQIPSLADANDICFALRLAFRTHSFRHAADALKYSIVLSDLP
jgi:hypothetical protein